MSPEAATASPSFCDGEVELAALREQGAERAAGLGVVRVAQVDLLEVPDRAVTSPARSASLRGLEAPAACFSSSSISLSGAPACR